MTWKKIFGDSVANERYEKNKMHFLSVAKFVCMYKLKLKMYIDSSIQVGP